MKHPVIGEIKPLEDEDSVFFVVVAYEQRELEVRLEPDNCTIESVIELAAVLIPLLSERDKISRQIIAKELLETYNNNWREYDEMQEDETWKTVSNPLLSEHDFKKKFFLESITVMGDSCIEFWYDDSGLFAGHSIIVSSFDGLDFTDAYAQMFG